MLSYILRFRRWIIFHLIYRGRYSSSPGIPTLCQNYLHPYHESKFEAKTCNILSEFIPRNKILVPTQHNYQIKFDLIIPEIAIVEPHAFWSNIPEENSFYDYYMTRKTLASKHKKLKDLPMVVISNSAELNRLKTILLTNSNLKQCMNQFTVEMLEKYKISKLKTITEIQYKSNKLLIYVAIIGWLLALIFALDLFQI